VVINPGGSRVGSATGLGLAIALIALAVLPASADAKKRPDLVVNAAQQLSADHNFHFDLDHAGVVFSETTKNVGGKTASPTKTRLLYARKPTSVRGRPGPTIRVPRLAPGESDHAVKREAGGAAGLPFGSYYVIVCADDDNKVVEHDEDNNCTYTGDRFDVIVGQWTGSVSGHQPLGFGGSSTESWSANDLNFTFDGKASGGGTYRYVVSGTEHYMVSGSDESGCTYSGGGDYDVTGHGFLTVNYRNETYNGGGDGAASYMYEQACPPPYGGSTSLLSPRNAAWWFTGRNESADFSPPQLLDSTNLPDPYDPIHWEWDITASD
jgi:hypothetical protein